MIQLKEEYITNEKNISVIIERANKILRKRKRLYNRYTRKSDNSDVKVPLEFYITNIAAGYFGGKAPDYTVKLEQNEDKKNIIKKIFGKIIGKNNNKDEFQILIDYIKDYNDDSSFFYNLVKDYFITGACYGLLYETTNNEIVYANADSRQCVAIYDYSTPVQKIGLLRIWKEFDSDGFECNMVELITKNKKYYYKNSKLQPKEYKLIPEQTEDVKWLLVPVIAIENPDAIGIFEPVLSLIDTYEQIIQNNKNVFQYNDDAKLMVTGFTPENRELIIEDPDNPGKMIENPARKAEDERILKAKVFYTPDATGKIEWIIKNINDTASENHKKTLMELILMTVCVPNVTDIGFTNADNSSALEKKFFPLEQSIIQADNQFKKELLSMWENIVDRINLKKKTNFDFRDIQIKLKRNMPTEKQEIVNMAMQLRQLLSDETCMGMLPFDIDVESEKQKKEQETEENMINNFSNLVDIGKNKVNIGDKKQDSNKEENKKNDLEEKIESNKEEKK